MCEGMMGVMLHDTAVLVLCEAESSEAHWIRTMKGVMDVWYIACGHVWCRFPWR